MRRVLLQGPDGARELRASDFIQGAFRTALLPGEIMLAIRVPRLPADARWAYEKACRKPGDFAHAMAAVLLSGDRRRAVIGALGGKPLLLEGDDVSIAGATVALQAMQRTGRGPAPHAACCAEPRAGQGAGMSRITLTVNGETVSADVTPRTHLADFLREERLLTGTHLGCEHGVCGACTLLMDGAPARSCIAFAVACDGADVRTIEGLEDDPVIVQLRAAFTAEHALQCGYCTPGMLVTARDIVQRLPDADEARIRVELAGNLCRCTGYAGIVRAIRRVLAEGVTAVRPTSAPLPVLPMQPVSIATHTPGGSEIVQTLRLALPPALVWGAIRDPYLVAECVPGARLIEVAGDRLRGEVRASLGPIETLFSGEGHISFDDADRRAEIEGDGRDSRTGTRLSARAVVRLNGAWRRDHGCGGDDRLYIARAIGAVRP